MICADKEITVYHFDKDNVTKEYFGKVSVFAEVKARGKNTIGLPREFVDIRKQRKIIKTALCFMAEKEIDRQVRFDVIEIHNYNEQDSINHIENAFTMEIYNESY